MSDFSVGASLEVEIDERSLRESRRVLEDLGSGVSTGALAPDGGSSARGGRQSRRVLSSLGDTADSTDTLTTLADDRNEKLDQIIDLLEAGGGGLIPTSGGGGPGGGSPTIIPTGTPGGGPGGIGSLLLGLSLTPGSPTFFGANSKRTEFSSPEAERQANQNAQSFRRLVGLEGGPAYPGADNFISGLLPGGGKDNTAPPRNGVGTGTIEPLGGQAPLAFSPLSSGRGLLNGRRRAESFSFLPGGGEAALRGRAPTSSTRSGQGAAQPVSVGTITVTPQITVRLDSGGGGLSRELRKKFEELGQRVDEQVQTKLDEELRRQFSQLPGSF